MKTAAFPKVGIWMCPPESKTETSLDELVFVGSSLIPSAELTGHSSRERFHVYWSVLCGQTMKDTMHTKIPPALGEQRMLKELETYKQRLVTWQVISYSSIADATDVWKAKQKRSYDVSKAVKQTMGWKTQWSWEWPVAPGGVSGMDGMARWMVADGDRRRGPGVPGWLGRLSVRLLISAQVMTSWCTGLRPASGSALTARSLLGILSPSLCTSPAHLHMYSL